MAAILRSYLAFQVFQLVGNLVGGYHDQWCPRNAHEVTHHLSGSGGCDACPWRSGALGDRPPALRWSTTHSGQIAEHVDLPGSTCSYHLKQLVTTGITECWSEGTARYPVLRRKALDERFPGSSSTAVLADYQPATHPDRPPAGLKNRTIEQRE